ncbi:hypothetical protein JCM3765_005441 [Sporobolomyces pararoseus]
MGGELLPEPQLSICLFLARAQLFTERSEEPLVKTSIGLKSFNLHCQLSARFITYPFGSSLLDLTEWNPLVELNSIFRLHLSWAVAVVMVDDPAYEKPPRTLVVAVFKRFFNGLQSTDTFHFDPKLQELFEGWLVQFWPVANGMGIVGVTDRHAT